MAIRKQTYPRWYFYPFLHWYDLLGCIPIGSFRMLRLLRLISLTIRLQKMGIIDAILEDHPELGDIGTRMSIEAIELIKERVRVQHWKESLRRRKKEAEEMP